jgi:hypothetical protein
MPGHDGQEGCLKNFYDLCATTYTHACEEEFDQVTTEYRSGPRTHHILADLWQRMRDGAAQSEIGLEVGLQQGIIGDADDGH